MLLVRMIVLSLMVGFVAAGFVWFGADLIENLKTVRRRRAAGHKARARDEAPTDEPSARGSGR